MVNRKAWELGSSRSVIRELFAYGQQQRQALGDDAVCDFSLGNPATPPPKGVLEALTRLTQSEDPTALHGYTAAEGAAATREAVARSLNARFSAGVTRGDVFMTAGAAPALTAVFAALTVSPDTEFLALAPYFPEYAVFTGIKGARMRVVPSAADFSLDPAALDACLTPAVQAVILKSPNNPSGMVYTEENLRQVAEVLTRRSREWGHPIYIVCDEPYRELVYDGKAVPYVPGIYPNTVVCYSYSKCLSLPGDRIGYVLVPPTCEEHGDLLAAVAGAARAIGHVCAPATYQVLVRECADEAPDLAFYDENRRLLYGALSEMGYELVYLAGAFYLLCRAPEGDGDAFSARAREQNLLVVSGAGFGAPAYVRIAYCVSRETVLRSLPIFRRLMEEER
ncbi:MAG: pyridoxal phosphate-dependent aminotransferase [Clostridia bacterium]|nr:pyridoxal phosphate-dependent aminotransferase [Clostridia bacterium]